MAKQAQAQLTPQQAQAQNMALRQALLASSPRYSKKIGVFTETLPQGKTTRMKLFNVGVITTLRFIVTINATLGVASATLSPKAPYNAISNISLVDYEGVSRVNISGYQLFQIQSVRERTPAYLNNESTTKNNTMPITPVAVATDNIKFYLEVPVAYDPERDLRGAILGQTGTGDMFLNITWNNVMFSNANDDGVFNGAATTTAVINTATVELYQDYLFPQNLGGGVPLPMMDLMTVYGLEGNLRVSDNLSNGQERLLSFPNVRSVIGVYANWINNGIMSDAISAIRLVVNGNNVLQEHTLDSQQMIQRKWINSDLPKGTFFMLFRQRPVETVVYGNVQLGLTFSAAPTGNNYLEQCYETFYPKGSTLPGLSNQG